MNFFSSMFNIFSTIACNLPLIILGILGLCLLVVLHEFGHFIFAKLFNVYVPSFSVGFGPRLIEKKIGETTFAISAIPLGGYVEIAGSQEVGQGEQLHAKDTSDRSLASKPYWQKMCIIIGGILFNILFAYLSIALLFNMGTLCLFPQLCKDKQPVIGKLAENKPAQKAGLRSGDKIVSVNNHAVKNLSDLTKELKALDKKQASIKILRDNEELTMKLDVEGQIVNDEYLPELGIIWSVEPMPFKTALIEAYHATWSMIKEIFSAFINIFKKRDQLGGPLIIIQQIAQCARMGLKTFLFVLAFISINLAILNIFPLPIFDGGQALTYTIEAIMRRPLSDELKYKIHYFFWILVILLVIYLTYKDLIKITGLYRNQVNTKVQ